MTIVTPQLLISAVGCTSLRANLMAPHIAEACDLGQVNTRRRLAMFLAEAGHESLGLSRLVESLDYRADRLVAVFGAHRISEAQAQQYGRRPGQRADQESIANIVYGGAWGLEHLGNIEPGHGWLYRGRGIGQITGLDNHRATTELLAKIPGAPDLLLNPEQLEAPRWAALSFGAWWAERGLNEIADRGTPEAFDLISKRINGGTKGTDDRRARWARAVSALSTTQLPR